MNELRIRPVTLADADALQAIYAPYVRETAISFELEPPSVEEFAARIRTISSNFPYLVLEADREIKGYAYASRYHPREAYRYTVETSVYLRQGNHGKGSGSLLYTRLFELLTAMGFCTAFACIAVPNPQSIGFHERHGFRQMALLPRIGYKFRRWHDVAWLGKTLREDTEPMEIVSFPNWLAGPGRDQA